MNIFQVFCLIRRHKRAVLAGLVMLMILAVIPLFSAGYTNDVRHLFPYNSAASRAFDVIQKAHLADAVQLELISPEKGQISEFSRSVVMAAEKIAALPGVSGVNYRMGDGAAAFRLTDITAFLPQLCTPDILSDCNSKSAVKNALRQLAFPVPGAVENASGAPFGKELEELKRLGKLNELLGMEFASGSDFFIDRTSSRALITFDAAIPVGDADSVRKLYSDIDKTVKALPDKLDYRIISGCSHTLGNEETLKRDATVSGVLSTLFLAVLFCVFYRRDARALWIGAVPLVSSLFSLAVMSFLFKEICLYVIGLGSCVTGLAVDQGIHVYASCQEDDPDESIRRIIQPLACSAGTSIAVFALLAFTGIEAYMQFAFFAGVSLFLSCILAVFILPLLLKRNECAVMRKIPEIPARFSVCCKIFTLLLLLAAPAGVKFIKYDFSLLALDGTPERIIKGEEDFKRIWRNANSGCGIFACIGSTREEALEKFEKRAAALPPGILFSTLVKSESFRRGNLEKWRTPEVAARIASLKSELDAEAVKNGLPAGFFNSFFKRLEEGINGENVPVPALFRMVDSRMVKERADGCAVVALFADTPENIRILKYFSAGADDAAVLSGDAFSEMVKDDLLDRFFRMIPLGGLLVLIFAAAALKNWRDVLAAMIPVLTAFAVLALFFAVTQVKVTPASAFALVLLSGLAVDYGIYAAFLGRNPQAKQIRSAVFLSAATTVLGAGALLFSSHPALSGTGVVLAVGISAAAASGIWVEPLLFVRKQRNGKIYSALLAVSAVLLLSGCASVPQNELPDRQFSGRAVCTAGENKLSFMLMAKREAGKLSAAAVSSSGMLIFNLDKDGNISWGAGIPENFRSKAHILVQDISKIFLSYPLPELADRSGKEYILTENISGGSTLCGGSIFSSKWQVQYSRNGKNVIFERWGIFSPAYRLDIVLR